MLSTYEMEGTTEALEAGGQWLRLEALEDRLAPCHFGCAAVAASTGAAAAAAAGSAAGVSGCDGGAAAAAAAAVIRGVFARFPWVYGG